MTSREENQEKVEDLIAVKAEGRKDSTRNKYYIQTAVPDGVISIGHCLYLVLSGRDVADSHKAALAPEKGGDPRSGEDRRWLLPHHGDEVNYSSCEVSAGVSITVFTGVSAAFSAAASSCSSFVFIR